jgi:hypothetical protein
MAHYAKVVDGIVKDVIVAEPEFFDTFVDNSPGEWIQTSFNTLGGVHYDPITNEPSSDQSKALRKNFAGIGYVYDIEQDAFYTQQPYASWILNQDTFCWEPPIERPTDENNYTWNEDTTSWDQVDG